MNSFHILPAIALTFASGVATQAAELVGTREISIASPERGRNLSVTIWYPAEPGGEPVLVGDNKSSRARLRHPTRLSRAGVSLWSSCRTARAAVFKA